MGKGILEGVRVLSIEQQVAAPFCTMMLSDQGAEVIKIERPGVGDSSREGAPVLTNEKGQHNKFDHNECVLAGFVFYVE